MAEVAKRKNREWFFKSGAFPQIIGCVDGTHVSIIAPNGVDEPAYVNRKGYHSINVKGVCDAEGKWEKYLQIEKRITK